jgi:hypothetical protein
MNGPSASALPGSNFRMNRDEVLRHRAFNGCMACSHEDFHEIRTAYDRRRGLMVYYWTCERCGARLEEARREPYRPAYDPRGNDRFLAAPSVR